MSLEKNYSALLNEYKGNVFEFLVAQKLAQKLEREKEFLLSIDKNFFDILNQQQIFIQKNYPDLYLKLPHWANKLSQAYLNYDKPEAQNIYLMGKLATSETEKYGATDILIEAKENRYLSIKLAKKSSMINSKSSGVKSFIEKYFGEKFISLQNEFNQFFDQEFRVFALSLNQYFEQEARADFQAWDKESLPSLPGDLDSEAKLIYKEFCQKINTKLLEVISQIKQTSSLCFKQGILKLCSVDKDLLTHLVYLHHENELKEEVLILNKESFLVKEEQAEIKFSNSQISVLFKKFTFNFRLKAMNTFISPAYKINCSFKIKQQS